MALVYVRQSLVKCKTIPCSSAHAYFSSVAPDATPLKQVLGKKVSEHNSKVGNFRNLFDKSVIDRITLDKVYDGMRMQTLVCETSVLDPEEGLKIRGYSIPECQRLLPNAPGGEEPKPEGLWWLLLTGDIPTTQQVDSVTEDLNARGGLPAHVRTLLTNFPHHVHPMTQFSSAIAALSTESVFSKAYERKVDPATYWEYYYEDAMNLLAKLPEIAAIIYRDNFKDGSEHIPDINRAKDYSENFVNMLGANNPTFAEFIRLYLCVHADNEGGNVSAHACHLAGSALADPYLCYSAALSGLAGPLDGAANQECLGFLAKVREELGADFARDTLKDWIWGRLNNGKKIPGYGHSVLKKVDPRYTVQREFALKHLRNDPLFKVTSDMYEVVPKVLREHGKVRNPWPNSNAMSGVILHHYGVKEVSYQPVLFGVSRAFGCMAQTVWSRAMELPMEEPSSNSTESLMKLVAQAAKVQ